MNSVLPLQRHRLDSWLDNQKPTSHAEWSEKKKGRERKKGKEKKQTKKTQEKQQKQTSKIGNNNTHTKRKHKT